MIELRLPLAPVFTLALLPGLMAHGQSVDNPTSGSVNPIREREDEALRFEPYTGPPLYLDEQLTSAPDPIVVEVTPITERYADGTIKLQRSLKKLSDNSFLSDGRYREFHPNGQPFVEGMINDGLNVGEWKYYYPNGQLRQSLSHRNGQIDGTWDIFRKDGSREGTRSFRGGIRDGEWLYYDETGERVTLKTTFRRGLMDGESNRYYVNGKMRQQRFFKGGQPVGTHLEWDEDGNQRVELNYVDGKLHGISRTWDDQGKVTNREYRDGLPVLDDGEPAASDNG